MRFIKKLRNIIFDLSVGNKVLVGSIKTSSSHFGAYDAVNSDYDILSYIFRYKCEINKTDVLVDVGCGKGRVINYWLRRKLKNTIVGIEIDSNVAKSTSNRLRKYTNVKIINGDIIKNTPLNATIFYLFNPFIRLVLDQFRETLEDLFLNSDIKIIYYNPGHLDVFMSNSNWKITTFDIPNINAHKCAIITNN